jgi:hypothetical protein
MVFQMVNDDLCQTPIMMEPIGPPSTGASPSTKYLRGVFSGTYNQASDIFNNFMPGGCADPHPHHRFDPDLRGVGEARLVFGFGASCLCGPIESERYKFCKKIVLGGPGLPKSERVSVPAGFSRRDGGAISGLPFSTFQRISQQPVICIQYIRKTGVKGRFDGFSIFEIR